MKDAELAALAAKETCNIIEALADAGTGIRDEPTHSLFRRMKGQAQVARDRVNKLFKLCEAMSAELEKTKGQD
jgi:uncharacterized protein (UPF0262 family)